MRPSPSSLAIARTELVWPGKYDERGALVAPPRLRMPLECMERVEGENAAADDRWRNKLIWGENLCVLSSLADELAGHVDLIYIDPPFLAGRTFNHATVVGGIRTKAYYDTWSGGRDSYLAMMWPRLLLARELLSERGSMYFHIGPSVNHYVRTMLDEVFGADSGSEIIWKRTTAHSDSRAYGTVHDKILFYTKTDRSIWNEQYVPHDPKYVEDKYTGRDPDGRRYMLDNITSPNPRPNMTYVWKGHEPPAMGWRYSRETMAGLDAQGRIWYPDSKRKRPRLKRYLDESPGVPLSSVWTDIGPVNSQAGEDTAYDTQKPQALLERIVAASSEPGSLVLDFFCGAGTTLAAAEKLGRRWIGCDVGRNALQTSRKRLLEMGARGFEILSPGQHERQYWKGATFDGESDAAYVQFILDLYGAQSTSGTHVHGTKAGALVLVGGVATQITSALIEAAVAETRQRGVHELHVLGWEWEAGLCAAPEVRLFCIPREIMEERAVEAGDIRFFERAKVQVETSAITAMRGVQLRLCDFVLPSADLIPIEKRERIQHWSDYVDSWAVDWDFRGDTFVSRWQSCRTRRSRALELATPVHTYSGRGTHRILVKVTDLFGNETVHLALWKANPPIRPDL